MNNLFSLIDVLFKEHKLSLDEYEALVEGQNEALAKYAAQKADILRRKVYSNKIFIRGLIEISNVCTNDCYYCGIRKSNKNCERYKLNDDQIIACCNEGYELGFRTFVMQGGESVYSAEKICSVVKRIKKLYPDCAVTLSLGECSADDYRRMYDAGADRYLLRHETADESHYSMLHPNEMSLSNRLRCLNDLKSIGFRVGCGFMVGSPHQTSKHLAKDLKFIETFKPDMCGIGPFIPQKDTPFGTYPAGTCEQTVFLLSIIRLIEPNILLPATTALGTIDDNGREKGIIAGANVVMPNLSPITERKKYTLYDNKISTGAESAQCLRELSEKIKSVGFEIVTDRGDIKTI